MHACMQVALGPFGNQVLSGNHDNDTENVVAAAVRYDTVFYSRESDGAGQGRAGLLRVLGRISQIRSEGREERKKEGRKEG